MPLAAGLAWTTDPRPCWMVIARPSCAASSIVGSFGEAELGGEWLPTLGWYRGTVEDHAEGTTELTLAVAEDA